MFTHQHHLRYLLRSEHYTSESHYRTELERLFRPAWHPVAAASQLARPGDFITFELFGTPILLRNMDGELCCFLNVCPHRHARLSDRPKGRSPTLRCQFHGWEYQKDGRTARIPEARLFRPWDRENSCLRKFRVATWGEIVFVCLDRAAPRLSEFLAPLPESWGRCFEPPFRLAAVYHQDFACNWKVVIETSLESYHVACLHPKTFKECPPEEVCDHNLHARYSSLRCDVPQDYAGRFMNASVRMLGGQAVTKKYENHNIYPHVFFARMDVYRQVQIVVPTSATTCRHYSWLYTLWNGRRNPLRWLLARPLQGIVVHVGKQVFREDGSIYEAVQRGIEASPFPGVIGAREERIHDFQRFVLERCGYPVGDAGPGAPWINGAAPVSDSAFNGECAACEPTRIRP
ncbi:MAG: aromatic ring-hydroxylating dioxygenase subunit alpha [Planctomycetes bacterium]|nr:aromatic ring-hydroxylating dioxygenase subunit alpha [Planctomycetota bacterium]